MSSALQAEAFACLKGVELAARLGMQYVILETDAANMVKGLTGFSYDRSEHGLMSLVL
jgi:ribonuclease HI